MPTSTHRKYRPARRQARAPRASVVRSRRHQLGKTRRTLVTRTRRIRSGFRRHVNRRNVLWSTGALAIGVIAFGLAAAGALSEIAAWELGFAGDGCWFAAAWITGDLRKGQDSHLRKAATQAKSYAAVCGEPTVDGTACKNRGRCPHHRGGRSVRTGSTPGPRKRSSQSRTRSSVTSIGTKTTHTSTRNKGRWTAHGRQVAPKRNQAP